MTLEGFTPFPEDLAREYRARGYWKGRTVGGVLEAAVQTYPQQEVLVDEKGRMTYAQLGQQVERLARGLLALGIRPGDRVALQLPNWSEFLCAYFALARIGAVSVMLLPQHRRREVEYVLGLTGARAYLAPLEYRGFSFPQLVWEIRPHLPQLEHVILVGEPAPAGMISSAQVLARAEEVSSEQLAQAAPGPNDVSVILLTGGTTSNPKGVAHTHDSHLCYAESLSAGWGFHNRTVFLLSAPVAHNAGLSIGVNAVVLHGGRLVLLTATGPEETLKAIQREQVTHTFLVPTQAIAVLHHPLLPECNVSSLEVVGSGAAHVPPELVSGIQEKMRCQVVNCYGMTEGLGSATRLGDPFEVTAETVGRPICPGDEYKIVDEKGKTLGPGQEGELAARGPCVFRGYYNDEEQNRQAFDSDGFFYSGDLAQFDAAGNLRITGRKKDMIIRGGENISPKELEELLISHPKIEEVAVVGMPDERMGERICAFIRPRPGAEVDLGQVVSFLREREIASFKLPERVEIVQQFPLTQVGKISKKELREWIVRKLQQEKGDD